MLVELEVGGVDVHIGARQLAQLAQLRIRECRLHRAPATEHHHLLDPRSRQHRQRVIRGVGRSQLRRVQHQHPCDVDRDVAIADHDRALAAEVEAELGRVGVAVVPGDELGRAV